MSDVDNTSGHNPYDFYQTYPVHKRWSGETFKGDLDRFSVIMHRVSLPPSSGILELGFGEGHFLDWGRQRGHRVVGIEILPEMVEHARRRGHVVHLGPISRVDIEKAETFDLLAAFDVVEHLSLAELIEVFQSASRLLKPDGKILLQFPNTSSPFSSLYQSGDITHISAVSWPALQQIAPAQGWVLEQFFNARVTTKPLMKRIKLWLVHRLRDLIEFVFSYVYYGTRLPMDPNIAVILTRSSEVTGMVPTEHISVVASGY